MSFNVVKGAVELGNRTSRSILWTLILADLVLLVCIQVLLWRVQS
jgi:hypothetical protein